MVERIHPVRTFSTFKQPSPPSPAGSGDDSYSFKALTPSAPPSNIELLTERLFSLDHLNLILRDPLLLARFQNFLARYRPRSALSLRKYLDVQKAIAAVTFANALADNLWPGLEAAPLDPSFEGKAKSSIEDLLNDALPGYITHRITELVTDLLQSEITGQATPAMKQMVSGLAEVYCLTDPSTPDNPIVYASDEFFKVTQYDQPFVIGRNCRFLQGPRTSREAVDRLVEALGEGQEICEAILNYRRDGSPFLNLLLIAPLYDDKGVIRYFLGAQIDINGVIENGRGLESLATLLERDRLKTHKRTNATPTPQAALADLSSYLNERERDTLSRHTADGSSGGRHPNTPTSRRMIGMDFEYDGGTLWPAADLGPNGRLPGVFQNYFLVRHLPSLRIIFTSPALRVPGMVQSKFMARIRGPAHVRASILEAMTSGESFTAKIGWITHIPTSAADRELDIEKEGEGDDSSGEDTGGGGGKARTLHCTPMVGKDGGVGVWMVVFV